MKTDLIMHNSRMRELIEKSEEEFQEIQKNSFEGTCTITVSHAMLSLISGTIQAYIRDSAMIVDMEEFKKVKEKEKFLYEKGVVLSADIIELCYDVVNKLTNLKDGDCVDLNVSAEKWDECRNNVGTAALVLALRGSNLDPHRIAEALGIPLPEDSLGNSEDSFEDMGKEGFIVKTSGSVN